MLRCLLVGSGLAGLLLVLSGAHPLSAQAPTDSALTQLLQEAKTRRWVVRATTDSADVHQGVVTAFHNSTLTLGGEDLDLAGISLLERRISNRRILTSGAVVGGLAGLVMGAGLVAFACTYDTDCGGDTVFLLGGALTASGAAIGGVLGGLLGGYEWKAIWPAR